MLLDSSSERRFTCRECGRPRLKAVALLTEPVVRAKYMAQPLCVDHHRPGSLDPVDVDDGDYIAARVAERDDEPPEPYDDGELPTSLDYDGDWHDTPEQKLWERDPDDLLPPGKVN